MPYGPYLTLSQPSGVTRLLLTDIDIGEGGKRGAGRGGWPRPGPVYVPATGSIDLYYTSSVALSYEAGVIRGFIDSGQLTAEFHLSEEVHNAVQEWTGWGNYADDTTELTPITLEPNTWTQITSDGAGASTDTSFLPVGVSRLWDTATNRIITEDMNVGDVFLVRINFTIIPTENNTRLQIRLHFPTFDLVRGLAGLSEGAGVEYTQQELFMFYAGTQEILDGGCEIQVSATAQCSFVVSSVMIKHF